MIDLRTAQEIAQREAERAMPERALGMISDREHWETPDLWLVAVNSVHFYATRLPRHDIGQEWVVAVPKDGAAPFRPFRNGVAIPEQIAALGMGVAEDSGPALERVSDARLFASQPGVVYREWFRTLTWFRVRLTRPQDNDPDTLVLTLRFATAEEENTAQSVLRGPGLSGDVYWQRTNDSVDLLVTSNGGPFTLTDADVRVCREIEGRIVAAGLADRVWTSPPWHAIPEAVTPERYPELFST